MMHPQMWLLDKEGYALVTRGGKVGGAGYKHDTFTLISRDMPNLHIAYWSVWPAGLNQNNHWKCNLALITLETYVSVIRCCFLFIHSIDEMDEMECNRCSYQPPHICNIVCLYSASFGHRKTLSALLTILSLLWSSCSECHLESMTIIHKLYVHTFLVSFIIFRLTNSRG